MCTLNKWLFVRRFQRIKWNASKKKEKTTIIIMNRHTGNWATFKSYIVIASTYNTSMEKVMLFSTHLDCADQVYRCFVLRFCMHTFISLYYTYIFLPQIEWYFCDAYINLFVAFETSTVYLCSFFCSPCDLCVQLDFIVWCLF